MTLKGYSLQHSHADLTRLYTVPIPIIDWDRVLALPEPIPVVDITKRTDCVRSFTRCSKVNRFLKLSSVRRFIKYCYRRAKSEDLQQTQKLKDRWLKKHQNWKEQTALALALKQREPGARLKALNQLGVNVDLLSIISFSLSEEEDIELHVFSCGLFQAFYLYTTSSGASLGSDINGLTLFLLKMFFNTLTLDEAVTLYIYEGNDKNSRLMVRKYVTRDYFNKLKLSSCYPRYYWL